MGLKIQLGSCLSVSMIISWYTYDCIYSYAVVMVVTGTHACVQWDLYISRQCAVSAYCNTYNACNVNSHFPCYYFSYHHSCTIRAKIFRTHVWTRTTPTRVRIRVSWRTQSFKLMYHPLNKFEWSVRGSLYTWSSPNMFVWLTELFMSVWVGLSASSVHLQCRWELSWQDIIIAGLESYHFRFICVLTSQDDLF